MVCRPPARRVVPSCWQARRRLGQCYYPPCLTSSPDCSAWPSPYPRTWPKPQARSGSACWIIAEFGSTQWPTSGGGNVADWVEYLFPREAVQEHVAQGRLHDALDDTLGSEFRCLCPTPKSVARKQSAEA